MCDDVAIGWRWNSKLDAYPELAALLYVVRVVFTILILVVIVWMSKKCWYNEHTGEIDAWSILGIALLTVILTNIVFTLVF